VELRNKAGGAKFSDSQQWHFANFTLLLIPALDHPSTGLTIDFRQEEAPHVPLEMPEPSPAST